MENEKRNNCHPAGSGTSITLTNNGLVDNFKGIEKSAIGTVVEQFRGKVTSNIYRMVGSDRYSLQMRLSCSGHETG